MFEPGLCFVGLDVGSAEAVIRALAKGLHRAGRVKASFEQAAVSRERRSPTGLPLPGGAIALPHAEAEHVDVPAIAVATLARPVRFREMGNPECELEASLVVMPALTTKEQAGAALAEILERLRDASLRETLRAAVDPAALCRALERGWVNQ